jgi:glycosidase/MoaA/NifB/PqqE/SkfB family radical SAM enzyme
VWKEPGGEERRVPMTRVAEEDEHVLFRTTLPCETFVSLGFVRSDRASSGVARADADTDADADAPWLGSREPFTVKVSDLPPAPPRWLRESVVYTVFVDRFRAAASDEGWGEDPGPNVPAGGHLDGVTRSLDTLRSLGVDVLHLTPVHRGASCHRYDVEDPFTVDDALGGEAAFERLVAAAHARGMRVLVDFSLVHVGVGFFAYGDVVAKGKHSPYAHFFRWTEAGALVHYGERRDAPLLDLDANDVRALALRTVEYWASFGVDGIRLDAAADVPLDLARDIRERLRAKNAHAVVLGEVVPAHAWRWLAAGAVDLATDFGFHAVARDFLARGSIDAAEAMRRLRALEAARGGPYATRLRFLSTHDHARFASEAGEGRAVRAPLAMLFLFTSPGVPALVYAEERNLAAPYVEHEPEAVWQDRAPYPWGAPFDARLPELIAHLARLRREHPALCDGDFELVFGEGGLLVYRRSANGETIDVALNVSSEPIAFDLDDEAHGPLSPLGVVGELEIHGDTVRLGPFAGLVAKRLLPKGAVLARDAENAVVREREFASAAPEVASWPTRFDFALTEKCNLRCLHCITDAPGRTARGEARTLPPFLVDALAPALVHGRYFGFVHGGESLAAKRAFFGLLETIRRARAGAPYDVHLLTNGALLSERVAHELIDHGVTSLSVSLDGATAETNDTLRVGGRFDVIVSRMREVEAVRRSRNADLRFGLSVVVTRENVRELSSIVELAADIGLDWVKLEELVPVTMTAASLVVLGGPVRVQGEVERARRRGDALGLRVFDHTRERRVLRCALPEDPELAAFVRDDEYANRSTIHPCRVTWDHACIEPNGDVRMGDFFGEVIGSLVASPFTDIWRGRSAALERVRASRAWPCARVVACAERA